MLNTLAPAHALAAPGLVLHIDFTAAEHSATYPTTDGVGPLGLGFAPTGELYVVDRKDNSLYRTPAGGGTALRVGSSLGPAVSGLTFGRDGKLYVVKGGNGADIIEVDPATGAAVRSIVKAADIPAPAGIATDPITGDLFVAAGDGVIYRIESPASADPIVGPYRLVLQGFALHAITFTPDGTMWVSAGAQVLKVAGVGLPPNVESVISQPNLVGFVVVTDVDSSGNEIPRFIYANRSDGIITKIDFLRARRLEVLSGGTRGDYAVVGPDRCLYATQSASVLRVAGAIGSGLCDLARAGEAQPTLDLSWGGASPRIGGAQETVTARFASSTTSISRRSVTFTVRGANPAVLTTATTTSGLATLSYSGLNVGTDTITATAVPEFGDPIDASNEVTIQWLRALDLTGPIITPIVTGTPSSKSFGCPDYENTITAQTTNCGYFITAPSITWRVVDPETGIDLAKTNPVNCPNYPGPFTLIGSSPPTGTPVTCHAWNADGIDAVKTVILNAIVTPPIITAARVPAANAVGWNNTDVTVVFTCSWPAGDFSADICTGPQSFSAETGSAVANGLAEDVAGNRSTLSVPVRIDKTKPTIVAAATTADGQPYIAGTWARQSVTVRYTCADTGSGIPACPAAQVFAADTAGDAASGTATDRAGNSTVATFTGIKIDRAAPTLVALAKKADGAPYVAGTPTNQTVTVTFSCADAAGSGATCPPQTFATDGTYSVDGTTVTDGVGNVSIPLVFGAIIVDKTAPTITGAATTAPNASGWYRGDVTIDFVCSDTLAGVASCGPDPVLAGEGDLSATGTAIDLAGNSATRTVSGIRIDRTAPTSVASLSGDLVGGSYRNRVTVGLSATDPAGASGVASITYSASGAHSLAPVTVSGGAASFVVTVPGTTRVTYFATDAAGNVEAARTVTVVVRTATATTIAIQSGTFTYDGQPHAATAVVTGDGGLNAAVSVTYTPGGASAPVNARTYIVTATYAGDAAHLPSTRTSSLRIDPAPATLAWSAPTAITYGAPLSGTQLNATATGVGAGSVAGTFTYAPAAGTVLPVGTNTLGTTFTPSDANYTITAASVTLIVTKAQAVVTVRVPPAEVPFGTPYTVSARATGPGGLDALVTDLTYTRDGVTTATAPTASGTYEVTARYPGDGSYLGAQATGTLNIGPRELGVGALGCGEVDTSSLWFYGANVKVNAQVKCDGTKITGKIEMDPGRSGPKLTITKFTGFGRTADLRRAFIFGTTDDGRPVVVIVEVTDAARVGDKFELRIAHVSMTGDGVVRKGDVRIKPGSHCDDDRN